VEAQDRLDLRPDPGVARPAFRNKHPEIFGQEKGTAISEESPRREPGTIPAGQRVVLDSHLRRISGWRLHGP